MAKRSRKKKGLEPAAGAIGEVVEQAGAKHAGGRPSEFRPEFCDLVEKLCLLGATDEQIADVFDKSVATINNWKHEHPEFLEAIKRGKVPANSEVAASLFKRAQWHTYTEQQAIKLKEVIYSDTGKKLKEVERVEVVEVQRVLPPSDTSMIFWLKNRFPEQWRDKVEHDHTVNHVHRMSDDELERIAAGGSQGAAKASSDKRLAH